jgi:PAS domain S-box-containing protein
VSEPADERLRLLESAVVHARDAVVVTEYDTAGEPRIVLVNPAFTAQTGYESDEVVSRHPRLLVGPSTDVDAQVALRRAAEERRPITVELLHYRQDGTTFWVENSINPVTDEADQLALHYQPVVIGATGEVVAVEALVRWMHPQRGLLPPAWFIPLAEQTGLIKPLTLWVLDAALRQVRRWQHEGMYTRVAVNLSARLLHDPDLLAHVSWSLSDAQLDADVLDLEVTESAVMSNPQGALEVITDLSRKGVRFTIDDFGTGYSSLGYLKRLPVHQIKIDRTFVIDMLDDENDASIVRSVIELAHSLGVRVVAEGVEDAATHDRLVSYGCDYLQGFFLGRPVVSAEITGRLSAGISAS